MHRLVVTRFAKPELRDELQPFFTKQRSDNGRVVLEVGGECDAATLDQLNKALGSALDGQADEIVVDLVNTIFVDSLTLGALTAAAKQIRAREGSLRLVSVTGAEVKRALELTGLKTYLRAEPDR